MLSRLLRVCCVSLLLLAPGLVLAACGGSDASQEELDRARREGAARTRQHLKIKEIEKQLKNLKRGGGGESIAVTPSGGSTTSSSSVSEGSCGGGLSVGPNTTCRFAENVEADYYSELGSGSGEVYSYSPTTERSYWMYCTSGSPHECTGGNNASVYFP